MKWKCIMDYTKSRIGDVKIRRDDIMSIKLKEENDMNNDNYVNHEVRLQMVESAINEFKEILEEIRKEMRSDFKWLMGSILGLSAILISFLGSIALHAMKLT